MWEVQIFRKEFGATSVKGPVEDQVIQFLNAKGLHPEQVKIAAWYYPDGSQVIKAFVFYYED